SQAARDLLLDGRAPRHGDIVRLPRLACTLRQIAEGGRNAFYKGDIAKQIVEFSEQHDGMFTLADFADFDAQWIEPVSATTADTMCTSWALKPRESRRWRC